MKKFLALVLVAGLTVNASAHTPLVSEAQTPVASEVDHVVISPEQVEMLTLAIKGLEEAGKTPEEIIAAVEAVAQEVAEHSTTSTNLKTSEKTLYFAFGFGAAAIVAALGVGGYYLVAPAVANYFSKAPVQGGDPLSEQNPPLHN